MSQLPPFPRADRHSPIWVNLWKRISLTHSCRDPAQEIRGRRSEVRLCICNRTLPLISEPIWLPLVAIRRESRSLIADLRLLALNSRLPFPAQGRSDRLELAVARPRIGLFPRNRHFGGPWVPTPVRSLKTSNILPAGFEINVQADRLFFSREAPLKNWRGSKKKFSQIRRKSPRSHAGKAWLNSRNRFAAHPSRRPTTHLHAWLRAPLAARHLFCSASGPENHE